MTAAYQSFLAFSLAAGRSPTNVGQHRRQNSTSSESSGISSHGSIYEARPVSSHSVSPKKDSPMVMSREVRSPDYASSRGGAASGTPPMGVEQKTSGRDGGDDRLDMGRKIEGDDLESILSDPYAMEERDITYEDFMRYYGSPVAPLEPVVAPPPELPPIPVNAATTIGGRIVGMNARSWRPPVSGYRSYGSIGGHPFHHAPVAELSSNTTYHDSDYSDSSPLLNDSTRSYGEVTGLWQFIGSVLCCLGCFGPRDALDE